MTWRSSGLSTLRQSMPAIGRRKKTSRKRSSGRRRSSASSRRRRAVRRKRRRNAARSGAASVSAAWPRATTAPKPSLLARPLLGRPGGEALHQGLDVLDPELGVEFEGALEVLRRRRQIGQDLLVYLRGGVRGGSADGDLMRQEDLTVATT